MHVSSFPGLSPRLPLLKESVSPLPFPFSAEKKIYASSADSLLHHLFRALELEPGSVVLAPDYHRARTMRAIRSAGVQLEFYRTKRDLSADLEDVERALTSDVKVLYVIHHFGFPQPIAELAKLAEARGVPLVEDCTEALFSALGERPLGSFGAHAIFALHNALPVPNGAVLLAGGKASAKLERLRWRPCELASIARPSLALLAGAMKTRSRILGRGFDLIEWTAAMLTDPETSFDPERARYAMAPLSRHLLERIDFDVVSQRRRDAYSRLLHRLEGLIASITGELAPGVCPQFLPVAIDDKLSTLTELRAHGVEACDPGSSADPAVDERRSKDARWLREHAVGLPAHQDLGDLHLAHVVRCLRELRLMQRASVVHAIETSHANVVSLPLVEERLKSG